MNQGSWLDSSKRIEMVKCLQKSSKTKFVRPYLYEFVFLCRMAAITTHSASLKSILDRERLNENNFLDWERTLQIVLKHDRKEYVINSAIPPVPTAATTRSTRDVYTQHSSDAIDVGCIMLGTMEPDLQKQLLHLGENPFAMITQLREMFQEQVRTERFRAVKGLWFMKMIPRRARQPPCLTHEGTDRASGSTWNSRPEGACDRYDPLHYAFCVRPVHYELLHA